MKKGVIVRLAADLLADILLVVLAGDILYLYYAGTWQEPILVILVVEIIVLWLIIIFGLFRLWIHVKEVDNDNRR